jgi:lipopolysaccharide export LptBFGC system permease protein LptF
MSSDDDEESNISKAELIEIIKEWRTLDEEIKAIQKEIKVRRNKKKELSDKLIKVMRTNDIECFDINNGKLLYTKSKLKETINKSYLMKVINDYFNDDENVETEKVADYILENRNTKVKESIRCKLDKK